MYMSHPIGGFEFVPPARVVFVHSATQELQLLETVAHHVNVFYADELGLTSLSDTCQHLAINRHSNDTYAVVFLALKPRAFDLIGPRILSAACIDNGES